jgi:predicted Rossmann fold flavoprotein
LLADLTPGTWDVVVIGAGAAGLLAAARAAERGRRVLVLEKNTKPGVKILMSGGTRCNLTQATDARGIVDAFGHAGPFLHSALAAFGPEKLVDLIEGEGVATKVEPTGKIFPASDRALDVLGALRRHLDRGGATLALAEPVLDLARRVESGSWEIRTPRRTIAAGAVVLTTGGQSYPGCGTTGDGYAWASRLGHTVVTPRPALVPLTIRADWAKSLRGITVPDVRIRITSLEGTAPPPGLPEAAPPPRRGSLLFAHFGLSGPAPLDISRFVARHARPRSLALACDFLPDLPEEALERHLREAAARHGKRPVATVLARWLPRRLADTLLTLSDVPTERSLAELTRPERTRLIRSVKEQRFPLTGTLGFEKAEVTAGGIRLDEVDSRTMRSKLVPGLYVAGELLDLDGPIGGYNFQAAFSTGYLAGSHA